MEIDIKTDLKIVLRASSMVGRIKVRSNLKEIATKYLQKNFDIRG